MGFVNETIPEADLIRIDFSNVTDPLSNRPILLPTKWSIDRERDIALISLGGGFGENARYPHFFLLFWQGRFIHVNFSSKTIGNLKSYDQEITWKLLFHGRLEGVPEQEIIDTLKDALTCYGYMGSRWRDNVKAVHFDFDGEHSIGG